MVTVISHSPAETSEVGEDWGRQASEGFVIGLSGDLGAGKTQLVKGIARGMGFYGRVYSPSFGLVNVYQGGRLPLFHLDLYRLDTLAQVLRAGLEEYLEPRGVTVIEWVERWLDVQGGDSRNGVLLPRRYRQVRLETISLETRQILYEDFGS